MRISIIVPTLSTGGMELQAINQANELSRRGIDVQVIILSDADCLRSQLSEKILVVPINNPSLKILNKKSLFNLPSAIRKLKHPVRDFNPDHMIANLPLSVLAARLLKVSGATKATLWPYHHSTEYRHAPVKGIGKRIYHYIFVRCLSKKEEHHLYVSEAVRKDIESNERIKNGSVLYNAIPIPRIDHPQQKNILSDFELEPGSYIIIPGRLHPVKGHLFFLNATEQLIKDYRLKIVIAGFGEEEQNIRRHIEARQLDKYIILTGQLKNKDMLGLIAGARLCVIPSLVEGLGNVAIEALAVGVTVLSSNAGGLTEVISDQKNGYIFEKGNAGDLHEKFRSLLSGNSKVIPASVLTEDFINRFTLRNQIDRLLIFMQAPCPEK